MNKGWVRMSVVVAGIACFALVGCDDNPVSENRDSTVDLAVNPTFAIVDAADTTRVNAFGTNRYGDPTRATLSATACDSKITVTPDSNRVSVEPPDRWLVIGGSLGESCVALSGGGQTDTATVFVVPKTIEVAIAATVGSGATEAAALSFLNAAGNAATGFSAADVVFSVGSGSVADVDATGAVTGKSPGTTSVNVSLAPRWGASRTASASFTVVPGPFGGSVAPATANWGDTITISAAAGTFDDDTEVTFDGLLPYLISFDESSEFVLVGPAGMGSSPSEVLILNAGPNQLAFATTVEVPNPDPADANEPNNGGGGGGLTIDTGETTPASVPFAEWISVSGVDLDDVFQITLAAETTLNFVLDWNYTDADIDVLFYDSLGNLIFDFGCASADVPEACAVTFAAGTYYIDVNVFDTHGVTEYITTLLTMTP